MSRGIQPGTALRGSPASAGPPPYAAACALALSDRKMVRGTRRACVILCTIRSLDRLMGSSVDAPKTLRTAFCLGGV